MDGVGALGYLGIFAGSLLLSLVLVPLALRVAVRNGNYDHPGGYKQQAAPVPYFGGVAMLVAFSAAVIAAATVRPPVSGYTELLVILGAAVALGLLGLIDDLWGLGVIVRLVVVTGAALAVWGFGGTQIMLIGVPWVDAVLTVLWIVGITNAMNLLDNMDGLSAGVATIASLTFFAVAIINGQVLIAALALALAGCAVGFLRHNRYPAKIYMGDAGSLFLGFMLAVVGIRLRLEAGPPIAVFVPVLVLAVPILDTTLVTITRLRAGYSPFAGGNDHTSHRLVRLGMSVPAAVGLIYVAALFSSWLAVVMSRQIDAMTAYLLVGFWAAVLAVGGWFLTRATPDDERSPSVAASTSHGAEGQVSRRRSLSKATRSP